MCGFDNRKFSRNLAIIRVPFSTTNLVLVGKSVTGATLVAVLSTERPRRHPKAFGTPFHFIVWDPLERPASALPRMSGEKECLQMCDYSLHLVASRPAKVGDKLVTTKFQNSMTRGFAAIEECRRADSHDSHFGLTRRLGPERKGGVTMKHLRTACVALAFVATTVSGSAQTSLTPSQNTTNSRTIIPQPAPVMRERIVNPSAGSDIGMGAAEQPPTQNNVFVNGALAVPGAPANTDTVPAKFSAKNAADDELITIAYAFKTLTDDERRAVYQALKDQPAGSALNADIGTKMPPGIELQPVPDEVAARVPQTRDYRYAVAKDRVLLVGTGRIVVGVFADVPVSEGHRER